MTESKSIIDSSRVITIEIPPKDNRTISIDIYDNEQMMQEFLKLTEDKLKNISKMANRAKYKLHPRGESKYGDLPKALEKQDIFMFFRNLPRRRRPRLNFLMIFFFMLRKSERLPKTILWDQKLVGLWNEKYDRIDYLPIHGMTKQLLQAYINIKPYTREVTLNNIFNATMKKIGKEYIYALSKHGNKLRQYNVHSLRHSGITIFDETHNSPIKTRRVGRWKKGTMYGSQEIYRTYRYDDMRKDLEKAFKPYYILIEETLRMKK